MGLSGQDRDHRLGFQGEIVTVLPRLRRFACGLAGSARAADQLVHAAIARALTMEEKWRPGAHADWYMYRIIHRIWHEQIESGANPGIHEPLANGRVFSDEQTLNQEQSEVSEKVRRAVFGLPPEQKVVLLLTCVEGLSYTDAAEVLEISQATLKCRLARARLDLHDSLGSAAEQAIRGNSVQ